ncbi:hypothetical protein SAMN05518855_1001318 [Paenibacillus sp. CF384]|nr:hypothetical protein SAMN05518855_1001318 [Paenibacillus sp. CF384]
MVMSGDKNIISVGRQEHYLIKGRVYRGFLYLWDQVLVKT